MTRERDIEKFLHERVTAIGGTTIKLAPTVRGLPDRLVILPGGEMRLVELKAPDGAVSEAQRLTHSRLRARGVEVATLWSRFGVRDWLRRELDYCHNPRAHISATETVAIDGPFA